MIAKRNPAADEALEQRRLQLAIDANVVTDYTMANGMGGIDGPASPSAHGADWRETYEFQNEPDASLYFTDAYLPDGRFAAEVRHMGAPARVRDASGGGHPEEAGDLLP